MKRVIPILLLTALVGGALAQGSSPISLKLAMDLVRTVTVDGKATETRLPDPKNVVPGDVISQVVTVSNASTRAVTGQFVRLPVPKNTVYLAPEQGMDDARTEYSIDGGQTYAAAPLKKTVTVMEGGKAVQKQVEVKPSEYTSVRWSIPQVRAGESLKFGYRVQVK